MKKHLEDFEAIKKYPLNSATIDLKFWEAFKTYLAYDLKLGNPSSNKYLSRLKQIISFADDENYFSTKIDLKKFKKFDELHTHDMPTIALSEEELEVLYNLDLSANERLEKIRDLFLVECYTGQRYSDLESVMDFENTFKNEIIIYQGKTNARVSIPLTKKLCEHLEKIHLRYKEKKIPVISNQKFNDYLKELGQVAGFDTNIKMLKLSGKNKIESTVKKWELLTTHTGRRTFCTYSLQRGIPAEVIMRVSGHKSYEVFRKYIRLDQTAIQKEFNDKF